MSKLDGYLTSVQRRFFCCEAIPVTVWKDALANVTEEEQENFLNLTANHPLVLQYPVRKSYQLKFLHNVLMQLESQRETEIHNYIYQIICDLKAEPDIEKQMFYKHYILDVKRGSKKVVSIKESPNIVTEGTTGMKTWKGAQALFQHCIDKVDLTKSSILELGSGTGLLGLFLTSKTKFKRYTFSDGHLSVLKLLTENVTMNLLQEFEEYHDFDHLTLDKCEVFEEVEGQYWKAFKGADGTEIEIMNLTWENAHCQKVPDCDLILAADVVYDPSIIPVLSECLKFILEKNEKCEAVVACTVRNKDTIEMFVEKIKSIGLKIEKVNTIQWCNFNEDDKEVVNIYSIRLN